MSTATRVCDTETLRGILSNAQLDLDEKIAAIMQLRPDLSPAEKLLAQRDEVTLVRLPVSDGGIIKLLRDEHLASVFSGRRVMEVRFHAVRFTDDYFYTPVDRAHPQSRLRPSPTSERRMFQGDLHHVLKGRYFEVHAKFDYDALAGIVRASDIKSLSHVELAFTHSQK